MSLPALSVRRPVLSAAWAATLLSPSNASLHHLLAESLSRLGRHEDAIASRVRAIEGGLDGVRAWFLLAGDYVGVGDTVAEIAAVDSAGARAGSPQEHDAVEQARLALGSNTDSNEL